MKLSGAQNRERRGAAQAAQVTESQFDVRRLANLEPEQRAQLRRTLDAMLHGQLRNPDVPPPAPPLPPAEEQEDGAAGPGEGA
jgi:hypothetical protein